MDAALTSGSDDLRLSEVISALSYALDLGEGAPLGHAVRACAIGMRLGEAIGLPEAERSSLFYALLLKDAGCSSNAAKVSALFGADDRAYKHDRKRVDRHDRRASLAHLVRNARPGGSPLARARQLAGVFRHGTEGARELMEIRCERGAEIVRAIELGEDVAQAIRALDEHWNGRGYPGGVQGEDIPLLGRILGLAQTAEIFFAEGGVPAALDVARRRRGTWFDPVLVDALLAMERDVAFWRALGGNDLRSLVDDFEPDDRVLMADSGRLDRVAEAFARVVDAKSPYTGRHSEGVAAIAVRVGKAMDLDRRDLCDLRRAGLLHDIGKLGVSNLILDKPGKLTDDEWVAMRRHPELTVRILERVGAFRRLADVAGMHHERLDGRGYHRGLPGEQLPRAARILAVADVAEALTADRPYRGPLSPEEALEIMRRDAGVGLCAVAFAALEGVLAAPDFVATLAEAPGPAPASAPAPGTRARV